MAAKPKDEDEKVTVTDSEESETDSSDDDNLPAGEEAHGVTSLTVVMKTLQTFIKKNRKLKSRLEKKKRQIRILKLKGRRIQKAQEENGPSNSTIATVQDANSSERKDAIEIFPEEVWRIILGKLTNPLDLLSCTVTCQLLADILSKQMPVLVIQTALPSFYRYLPLSKLLELRLVCSDWNKQINSFLEDHPSLRPHDRYHYIDPRKVEYVNPILKNGLSIRNTFNFWNRDCNPNLQFSGNPFLGRYVTLILGRGHNQDEVETDLFYDKVRRFLELHGKEIFYLNLWIENLTGPGGEEEQLDGRFVNLVIFEVFRFLPNLRKLRFGGQHYNQVVQVIQNLAIGPASLPPAPMLESLEVDERGGREFAIDNSLPNILMRRYHGQLRKLHIRTNDFIGVHDLIWPKLTELKIKMVNYLLMSFRGIGENVPLLSKLGLDVRTRNFSFDFMVEIVTELTSNARLNTLRLTGLRFEGTEPMRRSSLVAPPALETLELDNFLVARDESSYTFLLLGCFPHIKNLHIFLRESPDEFQVQSEVQLRSQAQSQAMASTSSALERADEIIDLNKHLKSGGNVFKSNIWELMTNLNVLTFQSDVYTREEYKTYLWQRDFGRKK